jgi:tetratricopeptide (TPR) repeat protein
MNEAAGNLVFNFTVDCAAAWLAHQFGPHLPRLGFVRKYLSWIPVVILTVPGQFIVYESYVIERPWYALGLVYLFPLVAGAWYLLLEVPAIKYESQIQRGEVLLKYPRVRKVAVPLLVVLPLGYVTFIGLWLYVHYQVPKKNTIIVARFSGQSPEIYSPTPELIRTLNKLAASAGDIEVLPARTEVTPEDGPSKAAQLGRALIGTRNNATLVVWGWYAVSETHVSITGNLEFREGISLPSYARPQPSLAGEGYDLREIRYQVPITRINTFSLQADVASEIRARSLYILALSLLSKGQYQRAKEFLDAANSGSDQDWRDVQVAPAPKAKPYEHSRNGPVVDYLESSPAKAKSSQISGKWRVLVARAYTEIGLGHNDPALLDCAEAALLSTEPVAYFCLGQAHLKRAEVESEVDKKTIEATKAKEDCAFAAQRDSKFADALGCRADAKLLVASALSRIHPAEESYEQALKSALWSGDVVTRKNLILRVERTAQAIEALRDWNEYVESNPSDYYGFLRRGETYRGLGRDTEAEADYSRALTLNSEAVVAYNNRGALRLQKAIAAANTRPLSAKMSASPFEKTLWTQTLTDLQLAIKLSPQEPSPWCNWGEAATFSEQYTTAKEAFQRCRALAPDDSMRRWAGERLLVLQRGPDLMQLPAVTPPPLATPHR